MTYRGVNALAESFFATLECELLERTRFHDHRQAQGAINALAESFFATLECELLERTRFHDHRQAQGAIFEFIEGWYNPHRRHQGLGYYSPMDFERHYQEAA